MFMEITKMGKLRKEFLELLQCKHLNNMSCIIKGQFVLVSRGHQNLIQCTTDYGSVYSDCDRGTVRSGERVQTA